MKHYLAFDLGATSGRTIIGSAGEDGAVTLREIHRFPNRMIKKDGHLYWDFGSLMQEIKTGLAKAGQTGLDIQSVGIDTWGVDTVFFNHSGQPIAPPYAYRDPQTEQMPQHFFEHVMDSETLYRRTGIQVMAINTLFQFYALHLRHEAAYEQADKILFMPDAFNYMLTGIMATEYTIASTSQLLNPITRRPDEDLLRAVGLTPDRFAPMVEPGTLLGPIRAEIAEECGIPQWPVIAVAGHDTASAVAAVHGQGRHIAYLSSGTWSLLGVETDRPILTKEAQQYNITNEGGVEGTIRFLKNITGMWIVENILNEWKVQGYDYSYEEMTRLAETAVCSAIINPDDPSFAAPTSMLGAIDAYCDRLHLTRPATHGEYLRCVFNSLAARYAEVLRMLQSFLPYTIEELHIIGGGSKNTFLNRLTEEATHLPVTAGPAEATAIGNIRVQQKTKH